LSVDLSCEVVPEHFGRLYPDVVVDGNDGISALLLFFESEMGFGEKKMEMFPCDIAPGKQFAYAGGYPQDSDWVFASPYASGKQPYWPESAMKDHVRPAAITAGITKKIGWHTFRHSLASLLGQEGEDVKVIQDLLRHASSKITSDVYQQGHTAAKRSALDRVSGIFLIEAEAS